MTNEIIIVESPTKARIIKKFFAGNYQVVSSMGHVRDLPVHRFGVDVENNFTPQYEIIKNKRKVIKKIKKEISEESKVYLAMDEDREGEAIGWHLLKALKIRENDKRVDRIVFHEITKEAINEALEHPRKLNSNLVNAQQARRVLDRVVGYRLSPLLSKKIRRGLSAGRVQSVALKIIVEREKERKSFKPRKYFTVEGKADVKGEEADVKLYGKSGKKLKKFDLDTEDKAQEIVKNCRGRELSVAEVESKDTKKRPPAPFITSTLQQQAYNSLGFSPGQTMRIAQQLYEGIELSDGSSAGLITYMRTDSVKIAKSAVKQARDFIKSRSGKDYLPSKPNYYKSKKSAQEAHECIRPTSVIRTPEKVSSSLSSKQRKLYEIIWKRFVSCQMKSAIIEKLKVELNCADYDFRMTGQKIKFDGFMKISGVFIKENILPDVEKGQKFKWIKLDSTEHETKPPARFTPATLVNELEKNGIGRPSTYATIISTLFNRKYVRSKSGSLIPEEISFIVIESLEKHFFKIVDKKFTARMEEMLDEIAAGRQEWIEMIKDFYKDFSVDLDKAKDKMEKVKEEKTDAECPECGSEMVIRWGRNGKFMACSAFPKCRKTYNINEEGKPVKETKSSMKCPRCKSDMLTKSGRYGKFLACSAYPKCKTTYALDKNGEVVKIPLGYEKCPDCGKDTAIKSGPKGKFLACTGYPGCRFSMNIKKAEKK